MSTKKKPKKRLVRGKDWHAWAWVDGDGVFRHASEYIIAKPTWKPEFGKGKWVRVKFVEVKS